MRGEHPHATGLKRWGRKEEPKKGGCKTACSSGEMKFEGHDQDS